MTKLVKALAVIAVVVGFVLMMMDSNNAEVFLRTKVYAVIIIGTGVAVVLIANQVEEIMKNRK